MLPLRSLARWKSSNFGIGSSISRLMSTSQVHKKEGGSDSYEGSGKTTVDILNDDDGSNLMITAYAKDGFRLNNGMRVFGSMAILPCGLFSWNVASPKELTEQSLALFSILNPKPEMVIVGVGDDTSGVDYKPLLSLKSKGINVNIMSTEHAISTYNYLCCENRMVAAALIPPTKMRNLNLEDSYERNKHFKADDVFGEDRFGGKGGGNTWLT